MPSNKRGENTIFHQYALIPTSKTIHSSGQMEYDKNEVDDRAKINGGLHQYAHMPTSKMIHSSGQMEYYKNEVDDRAKINAGLHQYAHVPTSKTIHSSGQMEYYKNEVDDRAKINGRLHRTTTIDFGMVVNFILVVFQLSRGVNRLARGYVCIWVEYWSW
jgi:hypothetical protein